VWVTVLVLIAGAATSCVCGNQEIIQTHEYAANKGGLVVRGRIFFKNVATGRKIP
jgi:hypothetical protein